jgi:PAS domain S-box-containing protein
MSLGKRERMKALPKMLADAERLLHTVLELTAFRYLFALTIFALALAMRLAIFPLDGGYPFFTFYPAVVLSALLCGTVPTLVGIALSSFIIDFLLIPPAWVVSLTYEALSSISIYVASSLLICLMIQRNRKREAEHALLAAIVRNCDVAIMSKTLQGTITSWNPHAERLFGYTSAEAIGQPMSLLFPEERKQEEKELLSRIARGENVMGFETLQVRKDGSEVIASVTLSPVMDRRGRIVGASRVVHDITRRKTLEDGLRQSNQHLNTVIEELKRSNQELDSFAYIASHDLKEPLRGIHNYASFLQEDFGPQLDDEGRSYLERMQRLTERMTALIDCLLALSRLGSAPLPMEAVDLNKLVDELCEDLAPSLQALQVRVLRIGSFPLVIGNPLRLREIFQNLIINGGKYNDKPEKWVEVGCQKREDEPVFYVRDNGIGIPFHHRENVFRIFKRLHEQDKYGGGTGAGLTIVKKIVERHHGRIWLESTEGEGTTFFFTLGKGKEDAARHTKGNIWPLQTP